ncbi:MAG: hypothetical protein OEV87_10980 [Phycisphaerae bacterium]|nr:hypothetical protein [Phycisphaerae bacterium]
MLRLVLTIRFILFAVFFLVGAGAIVLSILCEPELKDYYENRAHLIEIQEQNEKIKDLTQKYEAQIALIESEPNILKRLSPLTFGHKPQSPDTAFPQADNETLRNQTKKLLSQIQEKPSENPVPNWLNRVLDIKTRLALFVAGAGLILITFIFFTSNNQKH